METLALVVSGIASVLALVAFSVSLWLITHQPTDSSLSTLAHELRRARKAEAMRSVREAAAEAREASAPLGADGRPMPFGQVEVAPQNVKNALRRKVFGSRALRGNGGSS